MPNQGTSLEIVVGGQINNVYACQDSSFVLNKGRCGYIYLYDNSRAYINGNHGRLSLSDNSQMHIYYSYLCSSLSLSESSEVFLYGYDFKVNNQPVGLGSYTSEDFPYPISVSGYFCPAFLCLQP